MAVALEGVLGAELLPLANQVRVQFVLAGGLGDGLACLDFAQDLLLVNSRVKMRRFMLMAGSFPLGLYYRNRLSHFGSAVHHCVADRLELKPLRKIILSLNLAPGDVLVLTSAVRDLHLTYPDQFITDVRTPAPEIWENNPYITPLDEDDSEVELIRCECPVINQSNDLPYHYVDAYRLFLSEHLSLEIKPHAFKGDVHLSEDEKRRTSLVDEITGQRGTRYWVLVSGGKRDLTAKWWDPTRCQEVVDHFQGTIQFVQCGEAGEPHVHPKMNNVIDLVGLTDLRQMVLLMHHADGVVCPVTMLMHLAAAVETKSERPKRRPCVVLAGGREPAHWVAYPNHQFLHRVGCLPCCHMGGCWRCRTELLNDGSTLDESLCLLPVRLHSGALLPMCMDMISADDVIRAVEQYIVYEAVYANMKNQLAHV